MIGMVGEACLPSVMFKVPWTPDHTLSFKVHDCSSEHSDLSFAYRFMSLIYGLGTLTTNFLLMMFVLS